jgi:hypothetical protein
MEPMRNAHDRIAKLGIIGLAGIAILGWVRQPEIHIQPVPAAERAVFQPPHKTLESKKVPESQGIEKHRETNETPAIKMQPRPVPVKRAPIQRSSVAAPPEREPVLEATRQESSRHEFPQSDREAEQIRGREPELTPQPRPKEDIRDTASTHAPDPIVQNTKRSGTRSIAIIAGAAAAGAAIGGIAGHGKGAAIGAAAGAASGYVYDRMSRRNSRIPPGSSGAQDSAQVHRFGTPYFN